MSIPKLLDSANRRTFLLLCLVNFSIPAWVLWQSHGRGISRGVSIWSGWISALLITPLFLLGVRNSLRKTGQRLPPKLLLAAGGLVVLSGLMTTIAVSATKEHNSYLDLAQSGIPLNQIKSERTRLVVELIRHRAAISAENSHIAASMKPIDPPLYSIDSFITKEAMQSTASQLKHAYDMDLDYSVRQQQTMQDFQSKMQRADPAFLKSFNDSMQDDKVAETAIAAAEQKWISSTLDLYDYAIAHSDIISVRNGFLEIEDQNVRKSLLHQVDTCKALQQMMLDARQKAVGRQNKLQDAFGLSPTK